MIHETEEAELDALRAKMLMPGDEGYDAGRAVWNGSIDQHPAVIIRCTTEIDVQAAVLTAREQGLQIAVRSGMLPPTPIVIRRG